MEEGPGLASGSTNMMLCVHILSISLSVGHFWTTTTGTSNSNGAGEHSTGEKRTEGCCWFRNAHSKKHTYPCSAFAVYSPDA